MSYFFVAHARALLVAGVMALLFVAGTGSARADSHTMGLGAGDTYLSFGLGYSIPGDTVVTTSRFSFTLNNNNRTRLIEGTLDDSFIISAAVGTQWNDQFRGEVELSYASYDLAVKVTDTTSGSNPPTLAQLIARFSGAASTASGSASLLGILFNGHFTPVSWDMAGTPVLPYLSGGLGYHTSTDATDAAFAYNIGAGLEFMVDNDVLVGPAYRFAGIDTINTHNLFLTVRLGL